MNLKFKKETLFYIILVLGAFSFIITGFVTHGNSLYSIFFYESQDTFQDFYHSISEVFTAEANNQFPTFGYPAMPNFFFRVLQHFIPEDTLSGDQYRIRYSQLGIMQYITCLLLSTQIFVLLLWHNKKGSLPNKILFCSLIMFSRPFLFLYERGNILFVSVILLFIFLLLKDNPKPVWREIGFISLAISASIKIYPAAFGLLLIKEKRFKEVLRLLLYGAIAFIVPFYFFSKTAFQEYLNSASVYSAIAEILINKTNLFFPLCLSNFLYFLKIRPENLLTILPLIKVILGGLTLFAFFVTKEKWKEILLLIFMFIFIPDVTGVYVLVFFSIPLLYFLNSDNTSLHPVDFLFTLLFCGIFMLLPFGKIDTKIYAVDFVESMSAYFLCILVSLYEVITFIINNHRKNKIFHSA